MCLTNYIKVLIGSLTILTLTTLVSVNSQANTTCTTNALGDRTCTTVTSGTTTGNVLSNSTFGTGNSTTTTGWSSDGHLHTHGNLGNFPYQSGMDQSGGVWAGEGHTDDNIYQDVDLVGDGHLTKSQINEGFTSTQSADVWFWNNIENDFTLKQTITASDGTVTTQTRVINDHDSSRNMNGGTFTNYANVYTESANSQNDYTIRAEMYNETAGTSYDNTHRGPDVDNVQLSITTAGVESITITPCSELGTCTSAGEDINDAVDLVTDDGVDLFEDLDNKVEDAIKDFEEVEVISIDTTMLIENDLGKIEEVKFEEFIQESFTEFLETNDLVEEFKTELQVEGITEEEFFEETTNVVMEELKEEFEMEEPNMTIKEELNEETAMTEETQMEEVKEEEIKEEEIKEESKQEESNESTEPETNTNEEVKEESNEATEERESGESVSNESEVAEDKETEGTKEEEADDENVEDEATESNEPEAVSVKDSSINLKVQRVLQKVLSKLKRIDQQLEAIQMVTSKGITADGADISGYINKRIYSKQLTLPDAKFYDSINILEQQQIYKDANLGAYVNNDPIAVRKRQLILIEIDKERLINEIQTLKKG